MQVMTCVHNYICTSRYAKRLCRTTKPDLWAIRKEILRDIWQTKLCIPAARVRSVGVVHGTEAWEWSWTLKLRSERLEPGRALGSSNDTTRAKSKEIRVSIASSECGICGGVWVGSINFEGRVWTRRTDEKAGDVTSRRGVEGSDIVEVGM